MIKNKQHQVEIRSRLYDSGMTVSGWARSRGFNLDTVRNVLYRGWGFGEVGPKAKEIVDQLKKEKLL